jgi:hypothetical protein
VITEPSVVASLPAMMLVQPSSGPSQGSAWGRGLESETNPRETVRITDGKSHLDRRKLVDIARSSNVEDL